MKKIVITSIIILTLATVSIAAVNPKSCTPCHGADWGTKAMNESKIVANMTHANIEKALLAYKAKDQSYGGKFNNLMQGQVLKYSVEELKAFSKTIGK